tara:strand:- start:2361 stop:3128 length:768 start_codon:yes stop_codon:yes gene_type:complete
MAEKENKVEGQDPIAEGVGEVNETVSIEEPQEEVVEQEMTEAIDWEAEAKKFQSMYDKKTVELDKNVTETEQLQQLKGVLEDNPNIVNVIEKELSGESSESQDTNKLKDMSEFDPWEAFHKPDSPSYKHRVANEQKLVHETVDKELAKLKGQMAMNNLRNELVQKHNLGSQDADEFINFATQPKANLPIDTLIKVWKESKGENVKPNENKEAVKKAKSIPKPAGVLQGGDVPKKSETDQVWESIMNAGSSGKLVK